MVTNHVLINLWLTLYKLKGWLASLDIASIHSNAPSTTERRPPCLDDVLVLDGGRD